MWIGAEGVCGYVQVGTPLVMMPNAQRCKVTNVYRDDDEVQAAGPGENLRIRISGIDEDQVRQPPGLGLVACGSPHGYCRVPFAAAQPRWWLGWRGPAHDLTCQASWCCSSWRALWLPMRRIGLAWQAAGTRCFWLSSTAYLQLRAVWLEELVLCPAVQVLHVCAG